MNRDVLLKFQNRDVKLVLSNDFVIYGKITEVFDDCFSFKTSTKTSIISFQRILEISPRGYDAP